MNLYRGIFHKYISVMAKQLAFFSCLHKHVHQTQHLNISLLILLGVNATKDKTVSMVMATIINFPQHILQEH